MSDPPVVVPLPRGPRVPSRPEPRRAGWFARLAWRSAALSAVAATGWCCWAIWAIWAGAEPPPGAGLDWAVDWSWVDDVNWIPGFGVDFGPLKTGG